MLIFIYIIKGIWLISMFLSSPSNTISVSSLEPSNKVSGFLHPLLWIPLFPPLFSCCTCQFLSLSSLYFNPSWSNVPVVPHSIHLLHWNCCCLGIHWVHCWIKIICLLIPLDKSVQQGGSMHVGTAKWCTVLASPVVHSNCRSQDYSNFIFHSVFAWLGLINEKTGSKQTYNFHKIVLIFTTMNVRGR